MDTKSKAFIAVLVACFTSLFIFIFSLVFVHGSERIYSTTFKYGDIESSVEVANTYTLAYFNELRLKQSEFLISPLAVQGTLYSYYQSTHKENLGIFENMNTSIQNWYNSGVVFTESGFHTLLPNDMDFSVESLNAKIVNLTNKVVQNGGSFCSETDTYSIVNYALILENSVKVIDKNYICYNGEALVSDTIVGIPFDEYTLYLSNTDNLNYEDAVFQKKYCTIQLPVSYAKCSSRLKSLSEVLNSEELDIVSICCFGVETTDTIEAISSFDFIFSSGFSFALVNNETGYITLIGKR
ncbi:MAG: hypothetical protein J6A59_01145 [Lachnospiraceae bacterium]|nr:hypothetical protein [Lachnospiraceae bacterium]